MRLSEDPERDARFHSGAFRPSEAIPLLQYKSTAKMVIVMFRVVFPALVFATFALCGTTMAEAGSHAARYALSCGKAVAASPFQPASRFASRASGGLLQIRDVRSAGGGGNGCWSACFSDFDECMGIRTKNLCVSRVKTCLETCDRLSNRPGM